MNCDATTAPAKRQRPGGDHRGSAASRRARKLWMLVQERWNGNGQECDCVHCGRRVNYQTVEADRIVPGGPYARWNVQPSCKPCNQARSNNVNWRFAAAPVAA